MNVYELIAMCVFGFFLGFFLGTVNITYSNKPILFFVFLIGGNLLFNLLLKAI